MPEKVRVACCQTVPDVGDAGASAAQARAALSEAVAAGAQIVVLPELCNSGYVFESLEEARAAAVPADGELLDGWAQEAARGDAVVVLGGFCEVADDGRLFNSAALVDRSGVLAVYRKLHLWNDESLWFTPGEESAPVVDTVHGRIGMGVCYDIEFPELTRGLALGGADLIALPTNWPRETPPQVGGPMVKLLARSTAYLNRVFVVVCDRGGRERGLDFEGGSSITAPDGSVPASSEPGAAAQTLIAECELSDARNKRTGPRNDAIADRRPEHYTGSFTPTYVSGRDVDN